MTTRFVRSLLAWSVATLVFTVVSARGASALEFSPAADVRDVCADTPLRITFTGSVELGQAGRITLTDTATGAVVERIDVAAGPSVQAIGGIGGFRYHPVTIEGHEVTIHPHHGALERGQTYVVAIEAGAFLVAGENGPQPAAALSWRFSTRENGPALDASRLVVASDGSGDFCTVQGALDSIPEGSRRPVTVLVKRGTYREIVCLYRKHNVTIIGEDRAGTVITYANNERFNGGGGNPYAGSAQPSAADPRTGGAVYRRGMMLVHQCDDFTLANLTLHNATPQGGSQAETIIVNGSNDARAMLLGLTCISFQDTIQINGQAYVAGCHVEGDVDFLWGRGPAFFENCTFRSLRADAYFTQVRNPATQHGFVFLRCVFEGAPGVGGNFLTRVEPHRFPDSEVVLLDCVLTDAVAAAGWQLQPARGATAEPDPGRVRFWEHNSRTPDGAPADVSRRLAASRQLHEPADAATIACYRDPIWVLGGWDARAAARGLAAR